MGLERVRTGDLALQLFRGAAPRLALLRALWPAAVGREVARRSEILGCENDMLRVRVPDARWRRALFRMQRDIVVRLRHSAGALAPSRLGFVEGAVADTPEPAAPDAGRVDVEPPPAVRRAAESIADPEIRADFLAAAARYLDRFKPERQADA